MSGRPAARDLSGSGVTPDLSTAEVHQRKGGNGNLGQAGLAALGQAGPAPSGTGSQRQCTYPPRSLPSDAGGLAGDPGVQVQLQEVHFLEKKSDLGLALGTLSSCVTSPVNIARSVLLASIRLGPRSRGRDGRLPQPQ
ncbi:hypothetical protein CB1_000465036 [Camelus ferus]|nr:hypothetical protein CB1_000465036 [Camelus ferus]